MKVAIYARVSMDENYDDKRFQDLENQLQPLRDFCKAMGYDIFGEYTDKMSGANPARPAFRKIMADALMHRFSGIIVWKIDRFSREGILPTLSYIKQLKERGIFLQSMTETWINTKDEGITEMLLAIMSWMASEERRKISERTKAGMARKKAQGKQMGRHKNDCPCNKCVKKRGVAE
jgi:DNA invertase Pin-like site-specific DNA recombinase